MNKAIIFALILLGISTMHAHADIVDLVGDMDNFGFGIGPNSTGGAFDNSADPDDLDGTFDQVDVQTDSEIFSWTHDFTDDPSFGDGFVATSCSCRHSRDVC